MNIRKLFDNFLAGTLAIIVHVLLLGVLLVSLEWSPKPIAAGPQVQPVQAVVVDEARVAREIEQLKALERKKREAEAARAKQLAEKAAEAKKTRQQEERRLAKLKKEEQERRRRAQAEEKKLAELRKAKEAETKRLEKLKSEAALRERRKREAEVERRRVEEARKRAEAARQKAEEEKERIEAERRKAEEEKRRMELAKKKAEEEKRRLDEERKRRQAELALQNELAAEQAILDSQRQHLRDRHLAEYNAQIKATVERNWIRPASAGKGLKCTVRVEQIPGGEVVRATVTQSSGNVAFDRSVETAVFKSSPLPTPRDPALFERVIILLFEPEE